MPITRSQKDKLILIDTSCYVYTLRKEGTSKIHWRCSLYRGGTCKAIVHTLPNSDEIIHRYNEHSHPASPELQNSVLINADITDRALGSQENTTAVIDGTIGREMQYNPHCVVPRLSREESRGSDSVI